jgi:PPOX class probable F420-dependent enzyme
MSAANRAPTEAERTRLGTDQNAWLCTVRPDGRPHMTPIWFVFVDDRFWFATGQTTVKARNVVAEPRVSVSLEDGDDPVVAEGRVTVHFDLRPAGVAAAFAAKYDWDITIPIAPRVGRILLLELVIDKWLTVSD